MKWSNTILVIGFSIALFMSCKGREEASEASTEFIQGEKTAAGIRISKEQFASRNMALGSLDTITVKEEVSSQGYIDVPPEGRAVVSAPMPGFVKNAPYIVGEKVKQGQLLITLENPEFVNLQQRFLKALAEQQYLKSEFEREKTLFEEQVSSRKSFLKAESDYRKNQAELTGLRSQLELLQVNIDQLKSGGIRPYLNLYAPVSGNITQVMVNRGMYTPPNEALIELVNTDHLHVELGVFEKDVSKVQAGQRIQFYLPENPGEKFAGEVYKVGNMVQEKNRTVLVHGHIPDSLASRFPVGAYVQAEITLEEKKVLALPEEALLREGQNTYFLSVTQLPDSSYLLKKVVVQTGSVKNGYVPLLSNNPEISGLQFLTRGAFWFKTEGE